MKRLILALTIAALASLPRPAFAGAANFVLVNGTGAPVTNVAIRRATTNTWTAVPAAPGSGARANIQFSDPDCAFDIRAKLAGIGDVQEVFYAHLLVSLRARGNDRPKAPKLW